MSGMIDWAVAASIASAISAIAAAVSAYLSFRSIQLNMRSAKEQRASQAMLQYVDLSLRYPVLSTEKKSEHYDWYVIAVLETAREVISAYPTDKFRQRQMREQLEFHAEHLSVWTEKFGEELENYGPDVGRLVKQVVDKWNSEKSASNSQNVGSARTKRASFT